MISAVRVICLCPRSRNGRHNYPACASASDVARVVRPMSAQQVATGIERAIYTPGDQRRDQ
jgi:hypothetical protein